MNVKDNIMNFAEPGHLTLMQLKSMAGESVYLVPMDDWAKVAPYGLLFFGTADAKKWGRMGVIVGAGLGLLTLAITIVSMVTLNGY